MSRRYSTLFLLAVVWAAPAAGQKPGEVQLSGRVLTAAALQSEGRAAVLLFDDLNTRTAPMEWAKSAALAYLAQAPSDSAWAVLSASGDVRLAMTGDRAAVAAALRKLSSHAEAIGTTAATPLTGNTERMHGGGSDDEALQNHSAHALDTLRAAIAYAAGLPGPPVLLIVSTGFPTDFPANGTNLSEPVRRLEQFARGSGVVVNAIDPAALDPESTTTAWQLQEGVLSGVAQASGGMLDDNRNQLADAFQRLAGNAALAAAGDKLRQGMAGAKLDELPIEVVPARWQATKAAPAGSHLVVLFSPKGLPFARSGGRSREHVRVDAVLSDARGNWIAAREGDMVLALSPGTLQKLERSGIQAGLELPAPPGAYHVVIVAQELRGGASTALAANLAVR